MLERVDLDFNFVPLSVGEVLQSVTEENKYFVISEVCDKVIMKRTKSIASYDYNGKKLFFINSKGGMEFVGLKRWNPVVEESVIYKDTLGSYVISKIVSINSHGDYLFLNNEVRRLEEIKPCPFDVSVLFIN